MGAALPKHKILLLGEAPNAATAGRPDLWLLPDDSGILHSANRLLEHTGYDLATYLRIFERDNLLREPQPRTGKGRAFPIDLARARVPAVFERCLELRTNSVLMLGRRVASAFNWIKVVKSGRDMAVDGSVAAADVEFFGGIFGVTFGRRVLKATIVPHPSGVNRWWSNKGNQASARGFFSALAVGLG